MVTSPPPQQICRFAEVVIGQSFASTKEDADYIKLDDLFGERINDLYGRNGELWWFEPHELVYIGIYDPRVIY